MTTDIELISTDDLLSELATRHTEIIVIRNDKKKADNFDIFLNVAERRFDLCDCEVYFH